MAGNILTSLSTVSSVDGSVPNWQFMKTIPLYTQANSDSNMQLWKSLNEGLKEFDSQEENTTCIMLPDDLALNRSCSGGH